MDVVNTLKIKEVMLPSMTQFSTLIQIKNKAHSNRCGMSHPSIPLSIRILLFDLPQSETLVLCNSKRRE